MQVEGGLNGQYTGSQCYFGVVYGWHVGFSGDGGMKLTAGVGPQFSIPNGEKARNSLKMVFIKYKETENVEEISLSCQPCH